MYPWHQDRYKELVNLFKQTRLPHALSLVGEQGIGKRDFAFSISQFILCQSPSANQACGHCVSCKLFKSNAHPDFFLIEPIENSKVIKVEQIRELIGQLSQTAHQSRYQIALINLAEQMHLSAANALLKTLEEPQGDVLFLLLSEQPARLPMTVMSRCQRIGFSIKQHEAMLLEWLGDKIPDKTQCSILLKTADYAPLRAIALAKLDYFKERKLMFAAFLKLLQQQTTITACAEYFSKGDLELTLHAMLMIALDSWRLACKIDHCHLINTDQIDWLEKIVRQQPFERLVNFIDVLKKTLQDLRMSNLNPQLLLEYLFSLWQGGKINGKH